MDSSSANALQGCVQSLQMSIDLMGSSLTILDDGIGDFPRMTKVLQTTKHFELLPEAALLSAQQSLRSSIEPELETLLLRVEAYLDKLERREQSLKARAELQEGRLSSTSRAAPLPRAEQVSAPKSTSMSSVETMRLEQLKQKKQRLSYAVGRLELQATQRERQLRKSMAGH